MTTDYAKLLVQLQEEYQKQLKEATNLSLLQNHLRNKQKVYNHRIDSVLGVLLDLETTDPLIPEENEKRVKKLILENPQLKEELEKLLNSEVSEDDASVPIGSETAFLTMEDIDAKKENAELMKLFIEKTKE